MVRLLRGRPHLLRHLEEIDVTKLISSACMAGRQPGAAYAKRAPLATAIRTRPEPWDTSRPHG